MNSKLKRMILWVVIFALAWTLVPLQAVALEVPDPIVSHEESDLILNPLYEGLVGNLPMPELPKKSDAAVFSVASSAYASSYEEAGKVLRAAMLKRQSVIDVYFKTDDFDFETDMWRIFDAATAHTGVPKEGDTLGWGWIYLRYSSSYYVENGFEYVTLTYSFTYHTTAAQEKELDAAVDKLLAELNPKGSDYDKVCTIYDYMCCNITYDYANLYNDSYILKFSAYAALVDKTAVCQGYALLFYRLMLELGIDARFIGGTGGGGPHGWNIVQLGKYYYDVDSTWDAGRGPGVSHYNYFLLCEEDFTHGGTDHFRDPKYDTPEFHAEYPMSETNFDPDTPLLYAPELKVSNVASSGKPKLTWDAVSGAAKYEIYRSTSKNGTYKKLTTVTGTSLTNTSAEVGTTYYYKVRSVDDSGSKSEFSNIVSRTCDLPRPVVTLSNIASSGKVKITWEKVDGAVKYEVYRSKDNKNWSLLKTMTGTSLTNTSATAGTLYYYKVKAIHETSSANSAFSAVKNRYCDLPQPVLSVSNMASTGKIKLTWEAVEGAAKYQVYRSTDKNTWSLLKTTTGTSLTNTSTTAGTLYYYKIKAVHENSSANSAFSSIKSRRCDLARPTISSLTIISSTGKIKVKWSAVDGAVKYELYCSTDNKNWTRLTTTTGTSINHNSGVGGTRYYYKVRAIASNSEANSAYSPVKNGYCDLARPTLTVTLNSSNQPYLTWTQVDGAVNYEVYRSTDGTTWTLLKTTTGTRLTHTSAMSGTTYAYKVRAVASVSNANSAYSPVVEVFTPTALEIVRQPVSVAATAGETLTIDFEAAGDGLSYKWYYQTADSFTFIHDEAFTGNSYTPQMTDALDGCQVYCEVTDKYGNTVFTEIVTISLLPGELTEDAVYQRMIALQDEYPEGMPWTNDNFYAWNGGGGFSGGYGCVGFAFILSDAAFGTLPARTIEENISIDVIRVGDILRVNNNTHSVIILEVHDDHIVIAEGNYNSSIHWGRTMTAAEVAESDYVLTRYPEA